VVDTVPVSVIISTLNEGPRLRETLASVCAANVTPAEIIVVDDGGTDGSAAGLEKVEPLLPRIKVFHRTHAGIAASRSFGVTVSTEPLLVFLDAHCAVESEWLRHLVDKINCLERAIVVPTIANRLRPTERGCGARLVNDVLAYQWVTRRPPPDEVGIAPGGCFGIKRSALDTLGGFGAMRGFGLEDVELSLRAWRLGYPIKTASKSMVLHDFRKISPYHMPPEEWLGNVILTALLHFDGERLEATLRAVGGFSSFAPAITTVLSSNWQDRKIWLDRRSTRSLASYWQQHSDYQNSNTIVRRGGGG
jgi:glycosyltransferase involved in cell wall biosynthesis